MITAAELVEAVATNIKINSTVDDLEDFNVYSNLNLAVLNLLNTLPVEFLNESIRTTRGNSTAGISAYQWPTDYVRFVQMWIKWATAGDFLFVTEKKDGAGEDDFSSWSQPSTAYPIVTLDAERGYRIFPAPSATVEQAIRLRYVWQPPDIAVDQDCMLDSKWKSLIVYDASSMSAAVENRKPELAKYWAEMHERELGRFLKKTEPKT